MTAAAFAETIAKMTGLLPEMQESLSALAWKLTDSERDAAIRKLKPMNADIVHTQEEMDDTMSKQEKKLQSFKKRALPQIKKTVTAREQNQAEALINRATTLS